MLELLRRQLADNLAQRAAAEARLDEAIRTAETEGRSLNDAETTTVNDVRATVATLDEQRTALDAEITAWEAREAAREAAEARAAALPTSPDRSTQAGAGTVNVRSNEPVYRQNGEHSFFADLYASHHRTGNYWEAEDRLRRGNHQAIEARGGSVEQRALTVSSLAGAVPPIYLTDQFAAVARAGRPFLNSLNAMPLPPEGVSFFVPRGTTGSTAAMTAEGAAFNDTSLANTNDNPQVNLVTDASDVSRTLFMRGGSVVDQIIFPDLMAAAEVANNVSALNGNGTAPAHRGILQVAGVNAVTYTDATPTVGELWPKISDAIQRINSARFMPATAIYMHPRRWGWVTSALDTAGRPIFNFSTTPPNSVIGLGEAAQYGQVVGTLQNLPVVTDGSIPTNLGAGTNEDIIIIARTPDVKYWEDTMMQFLFEQQPATAPGQVRLAVGRFAMFHGGRYPTAISTIGGTGLITPTF